MRDATAYYLQKAFGIAKSLKDDGRRADIFGGGTEDIVFSKSGSFMDLVNSARNKAILEYHNVTIPEGISIMGNTFIAGRSSGIAYPFFLKVNGTLTVNGVLNMNGVGQQGHIGGGFHHNDDAYYGTSYTMIGENLGALSVTEKAISERIRKKLYHYGEKYPFFNGKTYLIGAGSCKSYKWKGSGWGTKYKSRHAYSTTPLNSGGDFHDEGGKKTSGGGGGFLALYYSNLDYRGPNIVFDGIEYPAHINANGGEGGGNDGAPARWGGGMMVIAAKNIVVGPKGYICCNPSTDYARSVGSPELGDSAYNKGGLALMNLSWDNHKYDYAGGSNVSGHNNILSGGPGVVFGYKINAEYREQNR